MNIGRAVFSAAQLQSFIANTPTQDVIWQPLYDFQDYGTQGAAQYTFFTVPIGQGTTTEPGASGTKTLNDTNLSSAGQLTKGNRELIVGVEMLLFPGGASTFGPGQGAQTEAKSGQFVNDIYAIGKGGYVTLTIGSDRIYVQDSPVNQFPPVTRLAVAAALATTFASTTSSTATLDQINYAAWGGEPYTIVPIYLQDNQGFSFQVQYLTAIAPPSATTARFGARLRGYRIRNAQ